MRKNPPHPTAVLSRQRPAAPSHNSAHVIRRPARAACYGLFLLLVSPNPIRAIQAPAPPQSEPSQEAQETQALQEAVRSAEDNPQALIKNLEAFLDRFPASARREEVLQFIYQSALRANDPETAIKYGELCLAVKPHDPALLASLISLLDGQGDASSRAKAIQHATTFVESAQARVNESAASAAGNERPSESADATLAAAYSIRGKLYAKSGELDKAAADFEKGYAAFPSPQLAEHLGDLAAKTNHPERALDEYATAFAFPGSTLEPSEREEVRRKLGSSYVALHASEQGLGDLLLARYDELERTLVGRFQDSRQPNATFRDPFAYVLKRPDGSSLPLADYRGKVLVLEFWASWCGPCRAEGKLFERVVETFRNEPAVFLAVNVDEDKTNVPAFLKEEHWTTPVVYAQGLDWLLGVHSLPTLVIFDRNGRVVFRLEGFSASRFVGIVERKVRETVDQSAAGTPQAFLDMTPAELAKYIPQLKNLQSAETQGMLPDLLKRVGANVAEFFDNFSNTTCTERVDSAVISPREVDPLHYGTKFNYLAMVEAGADKTHLTELRTDAAGKVVQPQGAVVTTGFVAMTAHFHPDYQADSQFRYLGRAVVAGQNAYVVGFAQRPAVARKMEHITIGNKDGYVLLQGVAWIDPAKFNILRLWTDIQQPEQNVGLQKETIEIEYSEVTFEKGGKRLWLPHAVTVRGQLRQSIFHNQHRYSHYRLFSVETDQKQKDS